MSQEKKVLTVASSLRDAKESGYEVPGWLPPARPHASDKKFPQYLNKRQREGFDKYRMPNGKNAVTVRDFLADVLEEIGDAQDIVCVAMDTRVGMSTELAQDMHILLKDLTMIQERVAKLAGRHKKEVFDNWAEIRVIRDGSAFGGME